MMNLLLFAACLIFYAPIAADGQTALYNPPDNIAVDCGYEGSKELQSKRRWEGDINSKLFPLDQGRNEASEKAEVVDMSDDDPSVPYQTARLSASEFTYTIPVTPGPKFVRLHFYDGEYGALSARNASFSVGAGGYTLLSNFSVSLAAGALGTKAVVKEYCLDVEGSSVNITFTPGPGAGWLALVSGIEVVSVPSDLYFTKEAESQGVHWVGQQSPYLITRSRTALETLYRVDIGRDIMTPPDQDTGMFRSWETEDRYLTVQGNSLTPVTLPNNALNYSLIPNYTAPDNVYRTARSLGNKERAVQRSYNLTWDFAVDSGFTYMVRLHFCEIVFEMNVTGDRIFQIFLASQTAEEAADVIGWTGGKYTPYFRDYAVSFAGKGKQNLSLALHSAKNDWESTYADAILNGLEIFKLSDAKRNLAGPNPQPVIRPELLVPKERDNKKTGNRTAMVIGIVASGVIFLGLIATFVIRRGKRIRDSGASDKTSWWGPISFATTAKSTKSRGSTTLPAELCRHFSLAEIKAATNNFDEIFIIGVGGFGNVYKGYIDGGTTAVAIKRLKSESSQGVREFTTEIEMLSHLRHRHLVSLIGYCDDRGEMILVYEHMSRGTLRDHLYKSDNPPLTWRRRLEACVGAARGLHYLHTGAKLTVIHRDVKTTNILLDDAFVAKVSDFGLSKTGPTTTSKGHVSTVVKGSIGYLDPEYYRRQQLSEKSDVYSFGVVLCEVLAGRPPILRTAPERRQVSLAEWARSCHRNGTLSEIVDPNLAGKIAPECLKKYGETAISCMLDDGADRPSMNDVVWGLEFAIQLQQNAEEAAAAGGDVAVKGDEEAALVVGGGVDDAISDSDGTFSCSWNDSSSGIRSSGATKFSSTENGSSTGESMKVFSEIYDPKAR